MGYVYQIVKLNMTMRSWTYDICFWEIQNGVCFGKFSVSSTVSWLNCLQDNPQNEYHYENIVIRTVSMNEIFNPRKSTASELKLKTIFLVSLYFSGSHSCRKFLHAFFASKTESQVASKVYQNCTIVHFSIFEIW